MSKKLCFSVAVAALLTGCATATFSIPDIEKAVTERLQLHPAGLSYAVAILETDRDINREFKRRWPDQYTQIVGVRGEKTIRGFYDPVTDTVTISKQSSIKVIRHEIGHAVVERYFIMPVSDVVHEALANLAETD